MPACTVLLSTFCALWNLFTGLGRLIPLCTVPPNRKAPGRGISSSVNIVALRCNGAFNGVQRAIPWRSAGPWAAWCLAIPWLYLQLLIVQSCAYRGRFA